jgi:hypothetical protein
MLYPCRQMMYGSIGYIMTWNRKEQFSQFTAGAILKGMDKIKTDIQCVFQNMHNHAYFKTVE